MNKTSDRDYYERRLREEQAMTAAAPDAGTARIHAKMAEAYARKLALIDDRSKAGD